MRGRAASGCGNPCGWVTGGKKGGEWAWMCGRVCVRCGAPCQGWIRRGLPREGRTGPQKGTGQLERLLLFWSCSLCGVDAAPDDRTLPIPEHDAEERALSMRCIACPFGPCVRGGQGRGGLSCERAACLARRRSRIVCWWLVGGHLPLWGARAPTTPQPTRQRRRRSLDPIVLTSTHACIHLQAHPTGTTRKDAVDAQGQAPQLAVLQKGWCGFRLLCCCFPPPPPPRHAPSHPPHSIPFSHIL